ncbi:MAG: hypothetical protein JWP57_3783 [Spirosoma sp.]|nr:hypothetical protein [Spirosoma sp.]
MSGLSPPQTLEKEGEAGWDHVSMRYEFKP